MRTYKVLTFDSDETEYPFFVDESMLIKGIFKTSIPVLHEKTITIEKLILHRTYLLDLDHNTKQWIENIKKCMLIEVSLNLG
jgi:hypothetical protein